MIMFYVYVFDNCFVFLCYFFHQMIVFSEDTPHHSFRSSVRRRCCAIANSLLVVFCISMFLLSVVFTPVVFLRPQCCVL